MVMCGECPPKGREARNRMGGPVCTKEPYHNWNGVRSPHSWEADGQATLTGLLLRRIYEAQEEAPMTDIRTSTVEGKHKWEG